MEARLSSSLGLPSPDPNLHPPITTDFTSLFTHFNTLTSSTQNPLKTPQNHLCFASTTISADPHPNWLNPNSPKPTKFQITLPFANLTEFQQLKPPKFPKWLKSASKNSPKVQTLMKTCQSSKELLSVQVVVELLVHLLTYAFTHSISSKPKCRPRVLPRYTSTLSTQ